MQRKEREDIIRIIKDKGTVTGIKHMETTTTTGRSRKIGCCLEELPKEVEQ